MFVLFNNPLIITIMKKFALFFVMVLFLALFSSCSAGLVIGRSNRQYQETKTSVNADSARFVPSITIN